MELLLDRPVVQRSLRVRVDPVSAFAALSRYPGAFWLDSGECARPHARFHHLGCEPTRRVALVGDPFDALDRLHATLSAEPVPGRPAPRAVVSLDYDLGRYVERVPCPATRLPGPEAFAAVYDAVLSFDLSTDDAWITAESPAAAARLERRLSARSPEASNRRALVTGPVTPATDEARWRHDVSTALEYIAAGDCYQVNLSHRFEARLAAGVRAADVYRRLRDRHPACYGAFFDRGDTQIVSNSPEGFLDLRLVGDRYVRTWPLKGTRPHDADPIAFRADPKERAEHVMIVDLERNDLGRIAVNGTVEVPRLLDVVVHPTVLHLESLVQAVPRADASLADILRATFPGGSITGAPKIRSMEIIAELEQERRGIYCGALGSLGWGGVDARFSIPIRTALVHDRRLTMRSGGGIVADSDPASEYLETLVKARAFLDVLG